jgi:hypothetical protein
MVLVAAEVTATRGEDREVIHFIDNSASPFFDVKGSSGQPQAARCSYIVGLHCLKIQYEAMVRVCRLSFKLV